MTALVGAALVALHVSQDGCFLSSRLDGSCAVRLPGQETWTGGLLWGGLALVVLATALYAVRRRHVRNEHP
jgi:LPXTG-motif cell wall-anchored protein